MRPIFGSQRSHVLQITDAIEVYPFPARDGLVIPHRAGPWRWLLCEHLSGTTGRATYKGYSEARLVLADLLSPFRAHIGLNYPPSIPTQNSQYASIPVPARRLASRAGRFRV